MSTNAHQDDVARLAAQLEREHPIRLQMLAVVTLAGLAGFLISFTLLHLGLTIMAIRYAIATVGGYAVFVVTVRIWLLGRDASSPLNDSSNSTSGFNVNGLGRLGGNAASKTGDMFFKGGRSGGGGASASFDAPTPTMQPMVMPPPQASGSSGTPSWLGQLGKGGGKSGSGSGKSGLLVIVVLAVIVIGLAIVGRVVWQSPNLIAEMLLDGAVAGTAMRGAARAHHQRDIDVVSHTWIPATIVLVLMVSMGWIIQNIDPTALSIGDVFR